MFEEGDYSLVSISFIWFSKLSPFPCVSLDKGPWNLSFSLPKMLIPRGLVATFSHLSSESRPWLLIDNCPRYPASLCLVETFFSLKEGKKKF